MSRISIVSMGVGVGVVFLLGLAMGWLGRPMTEQWLSASMSGLTQQATASPRPLPTPLAVYTIPALREQYQHSKEAAQIRVVEELVSEPEYTTASWSARVLGRTMTGVANIPVNATGDSSAVVLLRGWVPPASYTPGTGSKNAAAALAKAGFITVTPDFFGYGGSDPEPENTWQGRFEKSLIALSVLNGVTINGIQLADGTRLLPKHIGLWAHSNGGQIALSALAISVESIPTVLWSPVTAPFPYSLLYFSDEEADEGKSTRAWITLFDKTYDAREFSFTNYLDGLAGPFQLHQGTNDDAVLKWWSDEFVVKLNKENIRRKKAASVSATATSSASSAAALTLPTTPITTTYFTYPGADHNLQPGWDEAMARTTAFFQANLR